MRTTPITEELDDLEAYECMPGWDTLAGFVMVKGTISAGYRVTARPNVRKAAEAQLALAERCAPQWPVAVIGEPEATDDADDWQWVCPIADDLGAARSLIDLVTGIFPRGEWRIGCDPEHGWRVGKTASVLVRLVGGEVVAMVAPIVREPVLRTGAA